MLDRSGSEASFMRTRHGHRTHTNSAIVRHGFVCVMGSLQLAGVYIARARYIVRREKETIALKCDIYVDWITAIRG